MGGHGAAGAAAVGALHAAQAPRLRSAAGSYAAWKPDMDVYLERVGADGVHKRTMTDESWRKLALQVQSWSDEALAQALASIGVEDAATTTVVQLEVPPLLPAAARRVQSRRASRRSSAGW